MKNTNEHIIQLNYPDSAWGTDLARFNVLSCYSSAQVMAELQRQRAELNPSDFDSLQDMTDELCDSVAKSLGGSWEYISPYGKFDITVENKKNRNRGAHTKESQPSPSGTQQHSVVKPKKQRREPER